MSNYESVFDNGSVRVKLADTEDGIELSLDLMDDGVPSAGTTIYIGPEQINGMCAWLDKYRTPLSETVPLAWVSLEDESVNFCTKHPEKYPEVKWTPVYGSPVSATVTPERDKIIEECAHELDRQIAHTFQNAEAMRKPPFADEAEARARELGASYLREAAWCLRSMKSDHPLMKMLEGL